MGESGGGVNQGERGERAALVAVEKAGESGAMGEAEGNYSFKDLGDSLEQNNDSEGSRRVVGLLARLVEDNPIGFLNGAGVVAKTEKGGEEGHQYAGRGTIDRLPNQVGDAVGPGGRRG